jgi:hypothetical protein
MDAPDAPAVPAALEAAPERETGSPSPLEAFRSALEASHARAPVPQSEKKRGLLSSLRAGWRGKIPPLVTLTRREYIAAYELGMARRHEAQRRGLWYPGCGVDVPPEARQEARRTVAGIVAGRARWQRSARGRKPARPRPISEPAPAFRADPAPSCAVA